MPNQISGPNNAAKIIANSYLNERFDFFYLEQRFHANGRLNGKLIKDLRKQIKKCNPDLIHLSGLQASGFHAAIAAKMEKKKVLLAIRGYSGDSCKINPLKKVFFYQMIEPLTLSLSDAFYTVCSHSNYQKMLSHYNSKNKGVIYNSAPIVNFDIKEKRKLYRNILKCSREDFLVAISGRMIYDKGISFILNAIKEVKDRNIKFIFIGNGEYINIIKQNYKDYIDSKRIILLGTRNDVLEILSACDLFLFATLHENLSNALLEAMSIGLPVIATNVGGNPEVIKDGENGFLIPKEDSKEIVNKLIILKNNPDLCQRFSEKSKQIIKNKFHQNILLDELDHLYKSLIYKKEMEA